MRCDKENVKDDTGDGECIFLKAKVKSLEDGGKNGDCAVDETDQTEDEHDGLTNSFRKVIGGTLRRNTVEEAIDAQNKTCECEKKVDEEGNARKGFSCHNGSPLCVFCV